MYFFIIESSVIDITLPLIVIFLARGRAYSKKESSVMEITLIQGCFSYAVLLCVGLEECRSGLCHSGQTHSFFSNSPPAKGMLVVPGMFFCNFSLFKSVSQGTGEVILYQQ